MCTIWNTVRSKTSKAIKRVQHDSFAVLLLCLRCHEMSLVWAYLWRAIDEVLAHDVVDSKVRYVVIFEDLQRVVVAQRAGSSVLLIHTLQITTRALYNHQSEGLFISRCEVACSRCHWIKQPFLWTLKDTKEKRKPPWIIQYIANKLHMKCMHPSAFEFQPN